MKNTIAVVAVLIVFAGLIFGSMAREPTDGEYSLSTNGYTEVDTEINFTTVRLTGECREISFDVTEDQAYSIARGLENIAGPRPMTHDIFLDVTDTFGIAILHIRIDRYENDIYYARIFFQQDRKVLELDARPSDAIALAVRTGIPVYFREDILNERGRKVC